MNRILISGLNGVVGSNLKQYLNKNLGITGLFLNKTKGNLTCSDLSEEELLSYNAFIHLVEIKTNARNSAIRDFDQLKLVSEFFLAINN